MRYCEIAPSPAFADSIECFWSTAAEAGETTHRVSPDGCADIVLSSDGPMLVGAMTAFQDVSNCGVTVGVRFRPAMWPAQFRIPAHRLTDRIVPLEDLWGSRARALRDRVDPEAGIDQIARVFESMLQPVPAANPFQLAVHGNCQFPVIAFFDGQLDERFDGNQRIFNFMGYARGESPQICQPVKTLQIFIQNR